MIQKKCVREKQGRERRRGREKQRDQISWGTRGGREAHSLAHFFFFLH